MWLRSNLLNRAATPPLKGGEFFILTPNQTFDAKTVLFSIFPGLPVLLKSRTTSVNLFCPTARRRSLHIRAHRKLLSLALSATVFASSATIAQQQSAPAMAQQPQKPVWIGMGINPEKDI